MTATPRIMSSAVISECGKYRYRLTRAWGAGPLLPFIMLNPSTADAAQDDPTIRRCIAFAKREKQAGIVITNLFAYRATKPTDLLDIRDPIGPRNAKALQDMATVARACEVPIICAWGVGGEFHGMGARVWLGLKDRNELLCFGTTKQGCPLHPLYLPADARLIPFKQEVV